MRKFLAKRLTNLAYRLNGAPDWRVVFPEITDWQINFLAAARPYTMTEPTALWATLQAIDHVHRKGIVGDFVECGVWRGGNVIVAGQMKQRLNADFAIYAFDTFAGMTAPTEHDAKTDNDLNVQAKFNALEKGDHNEWCYASIDDVRANYRRVVGTDDLITVKGSVLDTLADPANLPEKIAVLRLDTDFYDSTKIELETLWPRVAVGGVLMIDDYGAWAGARKAADEFFADQSLWLHRVDQGVRLAIKGV